MITFIKLVGKLLIAVMIVVGSFLWWRSPPDYLFGVDEPVLVPESSVRFYADLTGVSGAGERVTKQEIWDRVFAMVTNAERYVLLDMFLFNPYQGFVTETTRLLSGELTERLLTKRKDSLDITLTLITDPINTVYGGDDPVHLQALKRAGVLVVETNLMALRDSNLVWSSLWRPFFSWFGNSPNGGWMPNPFDVNGKPVTLRSWLTLLNFKANHRKLIVADEVVSRAGTTTYKMLTLVTSANPHDASSAHGNVALEVRDALWKSVVASESSIAKLSNHQIPGYLRSGVRDETGDVSVTLLRERAIKMKVLEKLQSLQKGDSLDLAMFYLSDRDIIRELLDASYRGVHVRLVLDPNKDAFGFRKNGIPNRPVASELVRRSSGDIAVRWCDTRGEQCHSKLFVGKSGTSHFLLLGSANFTRRNLENFNLEASVIAERNSEFTAWSDAREYFETMWSNVGATYTTEFEAYEDTTWWKSTAYRLMEQTGLSSF